jgi:hypothetical protein
MASLGLPASSMALVAPLLAACNSLPVAVVSSDPGDERVATVQSALEDPTGTVSPSSVRALAVDWQAFQRVAPIFDAVLSVGAPTAQACLMGASGAGAPVGLAAPDVAADGGAVPQSGTYDLTCLSGGVAGGWLSFQFEPPSAAQDVGGDAGAPARLSLQLQRGCVSSDVCVTADAFAWIDPKAPLGCTSLATIAVDATVTAGGTSSTFSFGVQGGVGRSALMGMAVYFDDEGRSLTVQSSDASGDAQAAGPVLVTGKDQSFECTLSGSGGRCTGGGSSFSY